MVYFFSLIRFLPKNNIYKGDFLTISKDRWEEDSRIYEKQLVTKKGKGKANFSSVGLQVSFRNEPFIQMWFAGDTYSTLQAKLTPETFRRKINDIELMASKSFANMMPPYSAMRNKKNLFENIISLQVF